jgi:hypothetical protein
MIKMSGYYKSACLVFIFFLLISCSPKENEAEAKLFSCEKVLTIDTENDETATMGLTDITHFDIDSEGKIFIINLKTKENYIYILDKDGSLLSAFGSMGQGPGELQSPKGLALSNENEVFVTDMAKASVYSNTGQLLREFRMDSEYQRIIPLNRDRYLAIAVKLNQDLSQSFQVILCSSELEELKILDSSKIESFKKAVKVNIIPTLVHWIKSSSHIYTGSTDKYEIRVFDYDGNLLRTINKKHKPISLSDKDKEEHEENLKRYPPEIRQSFFIPDTYPPFKAIAALGDQWLFIQTYEEPNEGNFIYDIFDANGEFTGRTEIEGDRVKFKADRVYCLKQKASGYRELVVYKMAWDQ